MANFSSYVDLDYIAPSNACIKPMLLKASKSADGAAMVHRYEPGQPIPAEEIIKISLQDCLACSGCITTAETMLITSQSKDQIMKEVAKQEGGEAPRRKIAVTISDQSAASIAVQVGCSLPDALHMISGFCREVIGAAVVLEMRWAQKVSLLHTAREFVRRMRDQPDALPMIVSACPGLVCYCEKTHPQLIPFLCPIMSAQGIAGAYLKRFIDPNVYHISIQPCFDRKLEAVRDTFGESKPPTETSLGGGEVYTDCVLSSQEFLEWMREVDATNPQRWRGELDSVPEDLRHTENSEGACEAASLEGSGGYHQFTMQFAASVVSNGAASLPLSQIKYQTKRNSNHRVATADSLPGMLFGIGYGFQHIQNIVRGLNKPTSTTPKYSFIELMACPDGCLNGGGQVRTQRNADNLINVKSVFASYSEHVAHCNSPCDSGPSKKTFRLEETGGPTTTSQQSSGQNRFGERPPLYTSQSLFKTWLDDDGEAGGDGAEVLRLAQLVSTTFVDRKKDINDASSVHSLKW